MAKITVAIPTYNRQDYLKLAIESVLKQTFQDFEIIIFDNASDYNVEEFLAAFNDGRISLNRLEKNIGGFPNIGRALRYPFNSPYAMVFHDDDYLHPQFLEINLRALEKYPQAALAFSFMRFVEEQNDMAFFPSGEPVLDSFGLCAGPGDLVRVILNNGEICFSTIVYQVEKLIDFDSVQRFGIWSDRPFLIELSKNGGAAMLDGRLVNYRVHTGQISQQSDNRQYTVRVWKELYNYYQGNLPQPLSAPDKKLFLIFTTNSALSFSANISRNFKDFRQALRQFIPEYFGWQYLRPRGAWYLLKAFRKFYASIS